MAMKAKFKTDLEALGFKPPHFEILENNLIETADDIGTFTYDQLVAEGIRLPAILAKRVFEKYGTPADQDIPDKVEDMSLVQAITAFNDGNQDALARITTLVEGRRCIIFVDTHETSLDAEAINHCLEHLKTGGIALPMWPVGNRPIYTVDKLVEKRFVQLDPLNEDVLLVTTEAHISPRTLVDWKSVSMERRAMLVYLRLNMPDLIRGPATDPAQVALELTKETLEVHWTMSGEAMWGFVLEGDRKQYFDALTRPATPPVSEVEDNVDYIMQRPSSPHIEAQREIHTHPPLPTPTDPWAGMDAYAIEEEITVFQKHSVTGEIDFAARTVTVGHFEVRSRLDLPAGWQHRTVLVDENNNVVTQVAQGVLPAIARGVLASVATITGVPIGSKARLQGNELISWRIISPQQLEVELLRVNPHM